MNEELADVFARCFGMELIGLRYFNVFGPRQDPEGPYAAVIPRFFKACLARRARSSTATANRAATSPSSPTPSPQTSWLPPRPRAACGRAYNVAGGRATTVNELASAVREAVGGAPDRGHEARSRRGHPALLRRRLSRCARARLRPGLYL